MKGSVKVRIGPVWAIECVGIELAINDIGSETVVRTVDPHVEETGGGSPLLVDIFGGFTI